MSWINQFTNDWRSKTADKEKWSILIFLASFLPSWNYTHVQFLHWLPRTGSILHTGISTLFHHFVNYTFKAKLWTWIDLQVSSSPLLFPSMVLYVLEPMQLFGLKCSYRFSIFMKRKKGPWLCRLNSCYYFLAINIPKAHIYYITKKLFFTWIEIPLQIFVCHSNYFALLSTNLYWL